MNRGNLQETRDLYWLNNLIPLWHFSNSNCISSLSFRKSINKQNLPNNACFSSGQSHELDSNRISFGYTVQRSSSIHVVGTVHPSKEGAVNAASSRFYGYMRHLRRGSQTRYIPRRWQRGLCVTCPSRSKIPPYRKRVDIIRRLKTRKINDSTKLNEKFPLMVYRSSK